VNFRFNGTIASWSRFEAFCATLSMGVKFFFKAIRYAMAKDNPEVLEEFNDMLNASLKLQLDEKYEELRGVVNDPGIATVAELGQRLESAVTPVVGEFYSKLKRGMGYYHDRVITDEVVDALLQSDEFRPRVEQLSSQHFVEHRDEPIPVQQLPRADVPAMFPMCMEFIRGVRDEFQRNVYMELLRAAALTGRITDDMLALCITVEDSENCITHMCGEISDAIDASTATTDDAFQRAVDFAIIRCVNEVDRKLHIESLDARGALTGFWIGGIASCIREHNAAYMERINEFSERSAYCNFNVEEFSENRFNAAASQYHRDGIVAGIRWRNVDAAIDKYEHKYAALLPGERNAINALVRAASDVDNAGYKRCVTVQISENGLRLFWILAKSRGLNVSAEKSEDGCYINVEVERAENWGEIPLSLEMPKCATTIEEKISDPNQRAILVSYIKQIAITSALSDDEIVARISTQLIVRLGVLAEDIRAAVTNPEITCRRDFDDRIYALMLQFIGETYERLAGDRTPPYFVVNDMFGAILRFPECEARSAELP
jgi:hypothetical protein